MGATTMVDLLEIWDSPSNLGHVCVITSKVIKDPDGDVSDPDNWEDERIVEFVVGWEDALEQAREYDEQYLNECFRVIDVMSNTQTCRVIDYTGHRNRNV